MRVWAIAGMGIALALGAVTLQAQTESQRSSSVLFYQANERYRQGRFAEAIADYEKLIAEGKESGNIWYNLGNAYLKEGKSAQALWAYSKARCWMPRDADLQANLEYAQSMVSSGEHLSVKPPNLLRWLTMNGAWTGRELAAGAGIALWIACGIWLFGEWSVGMRGLPRLSVAFTSLVAAWLLAAAIAQSTWEDANPLAVVVDQRADVKFAPQDSATTHFALPQATVVKVLESDGEWLQISRGDGRSGWLPKKAVLLL